jgi:hypothetical protein
MTWPPDRYEGKLVLPTAAPASGSAPSSEESTFERIAGAVEALYEREPMVDTGAARTPTHGLGSGPGEAIQVVTAEVEAHIADLR